MLSAAQMAQMSRLLDEALELDTEARRRWLETLSPEHRDLERGLRRVLLPPEGQIDGGAVATLPKISASGDSLHGSTLQAGEFVGPYRLMRRLGAGGMAEVWQAQRADGAFKREVALKLPVLFRLREDLPSRFARERDILAGLEHPNIARLYDAGISAEGLPYLAMEYVQGQPLTAWSDQQHLGLRERLKLFLQVLDAVQYAHGRQVIHRDLKPSNILVTDSGQARLLDFGVAKLLAQEGDQTELTQLYGHALTPEYASPELLRAGPVDAASDLYSLGVVLYELLAGRRPYRLKPGASLSALEQAVMEARVQRPSTQLTVETATARASTLPELSKHLRGDLDAVVLMALRLDPHERYASAEAMSEDLQRYLSGQPVEARPPRVGYLLGKFVLRHRTGVAMTVGAVALVSATIGYEFIRSRTTSVANAGGVPVAAVDKSIAVLPFVDMSEKKDQEYFADGLSEELIDHLSNSRDLRVVARTSSFYFKGRQATIAEIGRLLGVSHLLEGSVRKVGNRVRITAQLIRTSDSSHVWSRTYDRSLSDVFKVQDDIALGVARDLKATIEAVGRGPSAREPIPEAHDLLWQADFQLAQGSQAANDKAIELYRRAISVDSGYAYAWSQLGAAYLQQVLGKRTPRFQGLAKAKDALDRALSLDPNLSLPHLYIGQIHTMTDWDWAAAQAEFQRARDLGGRYKVWPFFFAMNCVIRGRPNEAVEYTREIVRTDPLLLGGWTNHASSLLAAGRWTEAADSWQRAIALSPSAEGVHAGLGISLIFMGRPAEALVEIEKDTDDESKLAALPVAYWALNRRSESDAALDELKRRYAENSTYDIAAAYAYRGDIDAAFNWLDLAYVRRDYGMPFFRTDPLLQNLRRDPRFKELSAKMKLPD
jgi:serine/threonine protein kinase/TolB-like protein/Tfp pilus assembly protein PilF